MECKSFKRYRQPPSDGEQIGVYDEVRASIQLTGTARAIRNRKRQRRSPMNITLISLATISYIISSQFLMTVLVCSIRIFGLSSNSSNCMPSTACIGVGGGTDLVQLAAASPAPVPLKPESRRSESSHKLPVNGSMFGKRDLASNNQQSRNNYPAEAASKPAQYSDIVTEAIENFMASNSNDDPEETTIAFCRMIVYECNKLSNSKKIRGSSFRSNKKTTNNAGW